MTHEVRTDAEDSIHKMTVGIINSWKDDSTHLIYDAKGGLAARRHYSISPDSSFAIHYYENGETSFVYYAMNFDTTIVEDVDTNEFNEVAILSCRMDSFYRNGQLAFSKAFKKGRNVGIWKFYNEKGKLIDTIVF